MEMAMQKKCTPCEAGTPPLNKDKVQKFLAELKTPWEVLENRKIKKQFIFKDFKKSMEFVNQVAKVAEEQQHHPDIYIFYSKVTIELWTHSIGGLSENDFIMAGKIENI